MRLCVRVCLLFQIKNHIQVLNRIEERENTGGLLVTGSKHLAVRYNGNIINIHILKCLIPLQRFAITDQFYWFIGFFKYETIFIHL